MIMVIKQKTPVALPPSLGLSRTLAEHSTEVYQRLVARRRMKAHRQQRSENQAQRKKVILKSVILVSSIAKFHLEFETLFSVKQLALSLSAATIRCRRRQSSMHLSSSVFLSDFTPLSRTIVLSRSNENETRNVHCIRCISIAMLFPVNCLWLIWKILQADKFESCDSGG